MILAKGPIYKLKRVGLRVDPCETPWWSGRILDRWGCCTTWKLRSSKKDRIHFNVTPSRVTCGILCWRRHLGLIRPGNTKEIQHMIILSLFKCNCDRKPVSRLFLKNKFLQLTCYAYFISAENKFYAFPTKRKCAFMICALSLCLTLSSICGYNFCGFESTIFRWVHVSC